MFEAVRQAGQRIVQMVQDDLKPRDIMTAGAFANAVRAILSVGGSINCIKHLQAIATESECDVDVYDLFNRLAQDTPVLSAIRPVGDRFIEEYEAAGGARATLKQLEPLLDLEAMTVTGHTVRQNLSAVRVADEDVIRPMGRPIANKPAIVLLRGTLAPHYGIVKPGILERKSRQYTGPAICFSAADDAIAALHRQDIRPGHVLVMRGAGVTGGPGMGGGSSKVVFAIDGAGLGSEVALITDGHLSGLVCKGLVVAEVSPEGAVCGPLALVQDGDMICIDLDTQRCDLLVDEVVLAERQKHWTPPTKQFDRGWLQIYRRNVSPLAQGAVLIKPQTTSPTPQESEGA